MRTSRCAGHRYGAAGGHRTPAGVFPPVDPTIAGRAAAAGGQRKRRVGRWVRRIAFRLDPALHALLTGKATGSKTSQGQVVLDCVEAAHMAGVLGGLVTTEAAPTSNGGLIPRLQGRGTARPRSRSRSGCTPAPPRSWTAWSNGPVPSPAPS